jgi:phytoene dehydrogenase-like protein
MSAVDVAVVGGGHNALVCAAYLARAGYGVRVLERRPIAGGAAATEELIPGFRFDLGGLTHILTAYTSIVADLELGRHGLEYVALDPFLFAPFPDGSHIMLWRDLERSCASIAAVSPEDAARYRAFVLRWQPVARALVEGLLAAPSPVRVARDVGAAMLGRLPAGQIAALALPYDRLIEREFTHPHVRAMLTWLTAQAGPPPGAPAQAILAAVNTLYHDRGHLHARGGSGALVEALVRAIRERGGAVETGAGVRRILARGGRAVGVELEDGRTVLARAVVAGTHISTTLGLLGEAAPAWARRRVARARLGNGLGVLLACALAELPEYTALPGAPGPQHRAMQYLCPDLATLRRAYSQFRRGEPADEPALAALTFSAIDDGLAPPGRHVLSLWGQYYPHTLAGGRSWDGREEAVAEWMLETYARYAPNVGGAVLGRVVMSPAFMERTLGLARANTMHLEMAFSQLFGLRPALGLGAYRGPLPGLYLTGASTHPGGGISGVSGRNTATTLLRDFERGRSAR